MNKNELRKLILNRRKDIPNKKELSTIIVNKLINLDIYSKSRVVALYNSLDSEVDTRGLIDKVLKEKIVLLPRVIDNKMVFININKNSEYNKSKLGILEPIGEEYKGLIDLIIVPGVAFDRKRNRLGFGKGFYDKYLANKDIYKIGIGFNEQIVDEINIDNHDIKMDLIITEKEFI